jgi:hypothetical protein
LANEVFMHQKIDIVDKKSIHPKNDVNIRKVFFFSILSLSQSLNLC